MGRSNRKPVRWTFVLQTWAKARIVVKVKPEHTIVGLCGEWSRGVNRERTLMKVEPKAILGKIVDIVPSY